MKNIKAEAFLQKHFDRGDYQKIIASVMNKKKPTAEETSSLIGAYSFLGQIDEAQAVWTSAEKNLPLEQQIKARFYLGVALTRISKIKSARKLFEANFEAENPKNPSPYIYQGIGFYFYYQGNFEKATKWSRKALTASLKNKDTYAQVLATDLLGHATVQSGRRSEGLRSIKNAADLANTQGNSNFGSALQMSCLIYEAEVGARPKEIIKELEEAIQNLESQDSYTKNNLILELARQLTLRGSFTKAKTLLNERSREIYAFGNKRQEFTLQMRLAEIAFRQGDKFTLTHVLHSAQKSLNTLPDKAFELRLLGLEFKAQKYFDKKVSPELIRKIQNLSKNYSSLINKQMLFREGQAPDPRTPQAEDGIHNLFLKSTATIDAIVDSGYLGLYPQFAKIDLGKSFFHVLEDGESFIAGNPNAIWHGEKILSPMQISIMNQLLSGNGSKEQLMQKVWGYSYDPLRHDSVIYAAIGKLRKNLGQGEEWILTREEGWSLRDHIDFKLPTKKLRARIVTAESLEDSNTNHDLNFRQIKALENPPADGVWSVRDYKTRFKVSTMTAFRDLNHLHQTKLLNRIGKGRVCRYLTKGKS